MLHVAEERARRADPEREMSLDDWRVACSALNASRAALDALIAYTEMPSQGPDVARPLGLHPGLKEEQDREEVASPAESPNDC